MASAGFELGITALESNSLNHTAILPPPNLDRILSRIHCQSPLYISVLHRRVLINHIATTNHLVATNTKYTQKHLRHFAYCMYYFQFLLGLTIVSREVETLNGDKQSLLWEMRQCSYISSFHYSGSSDVDSVLTHHA